MLRHSLSSIITFAHLMLFCVIPVFSEEPIEEVSKAASHVERAIRGISQSDSGEGILNLFDGYLFSCVILSEQSSIVGKELELQTGRCLMVC